MTHGYLDHNVYLDHNATSPIRPEAEAAVAEALAEGGNPSSVHSIGRRARARVEAARAVVARAVGAPTDAVTFMSGGTEALNLAIFGVVAAGASRRLLIAATEHDATRAAAAAIAEGGDDVEVELVPVLATGLIDLAWLEARLARWDEADGRPFLAVMQVNNETGVIQPVAEAAALVKKANGLVLVDAVQALGKIDVNLTALGANYLALAAHKFGGPTGAGALVLAKDAPLSRRAHGGGQEHGRRAGTENVAAIAGFAAAIEAACDADYHVLGPMRDDMEAHIARARPDVRFFGTDAPRLPTTSSIALPGFAAETQVMALDLAGVAISAGAACSSGKVQASHVLSVMGAPVELAGCAIRVSLGWNTTKADVDYFVDAYLKVAERAVGAPSREACSV